MRGFSFNFPICISNSSYKSTWFTREVHFNLFSRRYSVGTNAPTTRIRWISKEENLHSPNLYPVWKPPACPLYPVCLVNVKHTALDCWPCSTRVLFWILTQSARHIAKFFKIYLPTVPPYVPNSVPAVSEPSPYRLKILEIETTVWKPLSLYYQIEKHIYINWDNGSISCFFHAYISVAVLCSKFSWMWRGLREFREWCRIQCSYSGFSYDLFSFAITVRGLTVISNLKRLAKKKFLRILKRFWWYSRLMGI